MFPGATEAHALPLATTNYEADEDGTLHAVLPSRCVYATGEQTCAMFVDHYRKRKTGPCYAVAVVGCRVHGKRRYTLYPAGHYPYGRVAVVPYSASGELLWEADRGGPPWQATLFGAAQDAAQRNTWSQRLRINGKPCNIGLGPFSIVTLAEAQEAALENARAVYQDRDPRMRSTTPTSTRPPRL